jgi:hypothetical protein
LSDQLRIHFFTGETATMIDRRDFLKQLGVESETRRESGEDKREFAELLQRDWLEFDRRRKR